jgi:hypothetical protein
VPNGLFGILWHQGFELAFGPFVVEKGAPSIAEERRELGPGPAGIALGPGAVEPLRDGPELHDEVSGLRLGRAPLLAAPKAEQRCGLLDITQSQLARAAKLTLSTVVDFEKGED